MPELRPYQRQAARAILEAVFRRDREAVSIEIARQGGKNEVSAQVGVMVLVRRLDRNLTAVKCAPTFRPQAEISMERLWSRLRDAGLAAWAAREGGRTIRLGRARQVFLSAEPGSNVVGHTADLLLEVDEAQDVDEEKFDKEFRPMAASTAAPVVLYGTPWDDGSLLERAKQQNLEAERRDGIRRHFEYDWETVAAHNPAYGRYVEAERQRLGAVHPLFLTQYCLKTIPGAGRLFGPTQLSLLMGRHSWLDGPLPGDVYVAGLDIGGEAAQASEAGRHDSTVLTIARLVAADAGRPFAQPQLEVVRLYAWAGEPHASLHGGLASLLGETWRVAKVAVDATGIGEPVAAYLKPALGASRLEARKLSAEAKSKLGFELLAAVNGGRLRLPGGVDQAELRECRRQLELCRATYRANKTMNFFVDERDGHDDYVVSLALAVAAVEGAGPRRAIGRRGGDDDQGGW